MSSGSSLSERDDAIFEHIFTHRLTVPEAVHRLYFADAKPNAVTKVFNRLRRQGKLERYDLYHRRQYWRLTPALARARFGDPRAGQPLKLQALVEWFGVLAFCVLGDETHELLSRTKLSKFMTDYDAPGLQRKYFVDAKDRLGYIHVDHGAKIDYVGRQCLKQIHKRRQLPTFRRLIDSGHFVFHIVTRHEDRADRIERTLEDRRFDVAHQVHIRPDLNHVMAYLKDR